MKKISSIIFGGLLALPVLVSAQGQQDFTGGMEGPRPVVGSIQDFIGLLQNGLNLVWVFLSIIIVFMFLYAAFIFVTARGDTEKIKKATGMITYGLIGVVVMILSGSVMLIVKSFIIG